MDMLFRKYKKLKKYWLELLFLFMALIITITSIIMMNINNRQKEEQISTVQEEQQDLPLQNIYIDVSGEVIKPNVYKVKSGARLNELINLAGGISKNADSGFFNRNYNLSRILVDQEKIYVPSVWEVDNGYFIENKQTLDFITSVEKAKVSTELININTGTIDELDTLSGIGIVTGKKIITNRPYSAIEELVTKKVINKNAFEKIKNLINI